MVARAPELICRLIRNAGTTYDQCTLQILERRAPPTYTWTRGQPMWTVREDQTAILDTYNLILAGTRVKLTHHRFRYRDREAMSTSSYLFPESLDLNDPESLTEDSCRRFLGQIYDPTCIINQT